MMALKLTVETSNDSINTFEFTLDQAEVTVGRSSTCHIQLPFPTISSHHLTIVREGTGYLITDMGSTNGTRLGDRVLTPDHYTSVSDGDKIILGDIILHVSTTEQGSGSVMSAERTGELVRHMVFEMIRHSAEIDDTSAYLEVLAGPDKGLKKRLPSGPGVLWFGAGAALPPDSWVLSDASINLGSLKVHCHGEEYALEAPSGDQSPLVDGEAIPAGLKTLRSGARIHIGQTTLLFFDPLQDYLDDLEERHGVHTGRQPAAARSPTFKLSGISPPDSLPTPSDSPIQLAPPGGMNTRDTKRVKTSDALKPTRTSAGLPVGARGYSAGLEKAGQQEEEAMAKASRKTEGWSLLEVLLLGFAVLLFFGAIAIFLVVLGVVKV